MNVLNAIHVTHIKHLADTGQIIWHPAKVPEGKQAAMRAFEGSLGDNGGNILVCQANVGTPEQIDAALAAGQKVPQNIEHYAMATIVTKSGITLVKFDPDDANHLFHLAAANSN